MRRRPKEVDLTVGMPAHLLQYDPTDWVGAECHPECAYWAAVEEWRIDHPVGLDDLTDGSPLILVGPDVPFRPERIGGLLIDAAHDQVV